jgi:hypothetical protein
MFNAWYDAFPICKKRKCHITAVDDVSSPSAQVIVRHKDGETEQQDELILGRQLVDDPTKDLWSERLFPWINDIHKQGKQGKQDKKVTGLFHKYDVQRADGRPVAWCFVLEDTDPLTIPALQSYAIVARAHGYAALADDLDAKVKELYARHYS